MTYELAQDLRNQAQSLWDSIVAINETATGLVNRALELEAAAGPRETYHLIDRHGDHWFFVEHQNLWRCTLGTQRWGRAYDKVASDGGADGHFVGFDSVSDLIDRWGITDDGVTTRPETYCLVDDRDGHWWVGTSEDDLWNYREAPSGQRFSNSARDVDYIAKRYGIKDDGIATPVEESYCLKDRQGDWWASADPETDFRVVEVDGTRTAGIGAPFNIQALFNYGIDPS